MEKKLFVDVIKKVYDYNKSHKKTWICYNNYNYIFNFICNYLEREYTKSLYG